LRHFLPTAKSAKKSGSRPFGPSALSDPAKTLQKDASRRGAASIQWLQRNLTAARRAKGGLPPFFTEKTRPITFFLLSKNRCRAFLEASTR
jgi:hypothetical protein